ncbi:MAG: aminotransferase class I/II-fold pyridoxal phosphate-dependent enzyme [Pseudomonadales bacterium]
MSQLHASASQVHAEYQALCQEPIALDLTRGKPSPEQLDLSTALDTDMQGQYLSMTGADTRNYGQLRGIEEVRALGAEIMELDADDIFAFGNASLTLMYQCVDLALRFGLWQDQRRWNRTTNPKVLAPAPGYDRHFALCERLGLELVPIPMTPRGPDMIAAKRLVLADASIKAIWCVPRYSNPTGCTYSDSVVKAIARLPSDAAADDFVVFWDNAYAVHHLDSNPQPLASIKQAAQSAGTWDHILQFASTSKITYASGGVAFVAASAPVLESIESHFSLFAIGSDKVNQLRHARFLSGRVAEHMAQHARLLRPKFELVQQMLSEGLKGWPMATWTEPKGGYFVSLETDPGLAARVVELAAAAGLKLTAAGATFPYGRDPMDSNIRIAPSFADLDELQAALRLLVCCLKLASIEQLNPAPADQTTTPELAGPATNSLSSKTPSNENTL